MSAALALPSATFQFPAETPLNIGAPLRRKLNMVRQFGQSAFATTSRVARSVATHVGQNWKQMAAGMVAGGAVQLGVKVLMAQFAAAGLATVLPGAAVTIIGGAAAGASVVMVKKATDTFFYNLAHKDDKKSYLKELTSRETIIKALTGGVGGALGAQILASNPVLMEGLQSMGHKASTAIAAVGAGLGRSFSQNFFGTAIHNALSKDGRQSFREAVFSKRALIGTAFGAAAGFIGAEAVANRELIGEALRSPEKLVSSSNLSYLAEKAGNGISNVFGAAKSFLGAVFGISSAEAQTMPDWWKHRVACPKGTSKDLLCVDDPINVLSPVTRQVYLNDEASRTGLSQTELLNRATSLRPIDEVRSGDVPAGLDDPRNLALPGNAPPTGIPRPIDQVRRGDVPTVLDDARNFVSPRDLPANGVPRPIDQVRVGDVPTALDDARNMAYPGNARPGANTAGLGRGNDVTLPRDRVAVQPLPQAQAVPVSTPATVLTNATPAAEYPPGVPVGRYGYLPPEQESKVLSALREGKDAETAVKLATEKTVATAAPSPAASAPAPVKTAAADAIVQNSQKIQTNTAASGALTTEQAMSRFKEDSYKAINIDHQPEVGRALLRRGVEISKANGLTETPTGQQLRRDLAYMDSIAKKPDVAVAEPKVEPAPATAVAANVVPVIAPEALALLPKTNQIELAQALSGKLPNEVAIRVFKDASYYMINSKNPNNEAGMELLRRGMEISKANGLTETAVGHQLTRDYQYMQRLTGQGAVRPLSHNSNIAPLAAKAA